MTRSSQLTFSAGCGGWIRRLYTELLWSNVSLGGAWAWPRAVPAPNGSVAATTTNAPMRCRRLRFVARM